MLARAKGADNEILSLRACLHGRLHRHAA